jgi:hypothetical protein
MFFFPCIKLSYCADMSDSRPQRERKKSKRQLELEETQASEKKAPTKKQKTDTKERKKAEPKAKKATTGKKRGAPKKEKAADTETKKVFYAKLSNSDLLSFFYVSRMRLLKSQPRKMEAKNN